MGKEYLTEQRTPAYSAIRSPYMQGMWLIRDNTTGYAISSDMPEADARAEAERRNGNAQPAMPRRRAFDAFGTDQYFSVTPLALMAADFVYGTPGQLLAVDAWGTVVGLLMCVIFVILILRGASRDDI